MSTLGYLHVEFFRVLHQFFNLLLLNRIVRNLHHYIRFPLRKLFNVVWISSLLSFLLDCGVGVISPSKTVMKHYRRCHWDFTVEGIHSLISWDHSCNSWNLVASDHALGFSHHCHELYLGLSNEMSEHSEVLTICAEILLCAFDQIFSSFMGCQKGLKVVGIELPWLCPDKRH